MEWLVALIALAGCALTHDRARKLAAKKWRPAIAISIAVLVHYIVMAGLLAVLLTSFGIPTGDLQTRVVEVMPGYDANGKLEAGDAVVAVDGAPFGLLSERVNQAGGRAVVLTIVRAGARRDVTVQPTHGDDGRWLLGVKPRIESVLDHSTGTAVRLASRWPVDSGTGIVNFAREFLAGSDDPEPGGPKRIFEEFSVPFVFGHLVIALILRLALLALLVQTVVDVIRARRG